MTLLLTLACFGGASDPESEFLDDLATATCDRAEECDSAAFDAEWSSSRSCTKAANELATCISSCMSGFDASLAEDGVQAVFDAECDTPFSMMFGALVSTYESNDLECMSESCYDLVMGFDW